MLCIVLLLYNDRVYSLLAYVLVEGTDSSQSSCYELKVLNFRNGHYGRYLFILAKFGVRIEMENSSTYKKYNEVSFVSIRLHYLSFILKL